MKKSTQHADMNLKKIWMKYHVLPDSLKYMIYIFKDTRFKNLHWKYWITFDAQTLWFIF